MGIQEVVVMENDLITFRTADLMGLSDTKRWTVIKTLRSQSVAEHCFNVAVIALELCERLAIPAGPVLRRAILHDAPETLTGDVNGKFKRDNPPVKFALVTAEGQSFPWYEQETASTSTSTNTIVKIADKIEAIQFIRQWGHGGRADSVKRELTSILYNELVPKTAMILARPVEEILATARQVLNISTTESHSIQERLIRGIK